MLYIIITSSIILIVSILIGIAIVTRDSSSKTYRAFGILVLCVNLWVVANCAARINMDLLYDTRLITSSFAYFFSYTIALSGLYFSYLFPSPRKINRTLLFIVIIVSVPTLVLSFTHYIVGTITIDGDGNEYLERSRYVILFGIAFMTIVFLIASNMVRSIRSQSHIIRMQGLIILLAFSISALFGIITTIVLPLILPTIHLAQFSTLSVLIFLTGIAYAMAKYKLFDVRLAVVRTLAYTGSLLTFTLLYFALTYSIAGLIFGGDVSVRFSINPINILLGLILAFSFAPIKNLFDRATTKIFYHDNYNSEDFIARLNQILARSYGVLETLKKASTEIAMTIKAEQVWVHVFDRNFNNLNVGTRDHNSFSLDETAIINRYTSAHHTGVVDTKQLENSSDVYAVLASKRITLLMPLIHQDRMIGYVAIGARKSGHYNQSDIKALNAVTDGLIIAIQNAQSVQEIKDINSSLEQRIEKATAELRDANSELQRLDATKDEFISMASHQLRTPLTSVKGYISMMIEGDGGKVSKTQYELLSQAYTSSERMVSLINDFLNVSRLQTGRFILDRHSVDLSDIVAHEVDSLKMTAKAHDLILVYRRPSYFPVIELDEGKIRQVIMNFIDNAIYYSRKGSSIIVQCETHDGLAVFKVIDTGIGVPQNQREHLFTKFFRANNAKKQRPDGTGVGLFLAKKVVDEHGGSILFESIENEGSTFGFQLPVKEVYKS